jgi:hypothetical protein
VDKSAYEKKKKKNWLTVIMNPIGCWDDITRGFRIRLLHVLSPTEAVTGGSSGDRGLRNLCDEGCQQVVEVVTEAFTTFLTKAVRKMISSQNTLSAKWSNVKETKSRVSFSAEPQSHFLQLYHLP